MRVRRLRVGREAGDMVAEAGLGGRVVAGQDELVGIAVELVGIVGRGQRRDLRWPVGDRQRLPRTPARSRLGWSSDAASTRCRPCRR